jgi:hypothetical protein
LTAVQVFLMSEEEFNDYKEEPVLLGDDFETDDEYVTEVYQVWNLSVE